MGGGGIGANGVNYAYHSTGDGVSHATREEDSADSVRLHRGSESAAEGETSATQTPQKARIEEGALTL